MSRRYKITDASGTVRDLGEGDPFTLAGVKYPRNWLAFGAALPNEYAVESYVVTPLAPPAYTPRVISKLQLVRAMRLAGLWGSVRAALAGAGIEAREDWEFASEVHRDDVIVTAFASTLGLTDADLNDLFTVGATL